MALADSPRGDHNSPSCTLCYYPFSLYSIMMRFAFLLGQKLNPDKGPLLEIRLINLQQDENLEEEYLNLNSKGQVPALILSSDVVLTDSFDINNWLCDQQPELLPEDHRESIQGLIREFYLFHARALTAFPDDSKDGFPNRAAAKLEQPSISDSHRRQLEIKSVFHDTLYGKLLDPGLVEEAEGRAQEWCRRIGQLKEQFGASGVYLFGDKPSILDAYATTLVARLIDLGRDDLLSDPVAREYAAAVIATDEWQKTTCGRKTVWEARLGPVDQLWPL